MRAAFVCLAAACLGACATGTPAPRLSPEEARQACLARMYTARSRGAVHWHIYENCLKDHS